MKPFLLTGILCLMICCVLHAQLQVTHDTVSVINAELVIRNASRSVQGYLYNTGDGITQFSIPDIARNIQFKTGQTGYPNIGDSIYTDISLIGRQIIVWRNGLLQYRNMPDGVATDSSAGKIFFRPALKSGERVYIEALNGVSGVF